MAEDQAKNQAQAETEAERALRARVHRHLGWVATLLVLVAIAVALGRMRTMFGVSPWEALGIGATTLPWIIGILVLGVVFSLGTSRMMLGLEKVLSWFKGKKS